MKKIVLSVVMAVVLVSVLVVPVFAEGKSAMSGKSESGHVYLFEKNPEANWDIVQDGAWGKLNYKLVDGELSGVFNGKGLVAGTDYSLIYYPEIAPNPWPAGGIKVEVLGSAEANKAGNLHIVGGATIGSPDEQPSGGDYEGQTGDKIWLVLTADLEDVDASEEVTEMHITKWNPTEYLFENNLINIGESEE